MFYLYAVGKRKAYQVLRQSTILLQMEAGTQEIDKLCICVK